MADAKPTIFSIPVHRAFADALAAGLIARFADGALGLAEGVVLLPSNRARSAAPRASEPLRRRLLLAELIERFTPDDEAPIAGAAAFQLADGLARVIDQLHYEEVAVPALVDLDLGAFADHWRASLGRLRLLVDHWPATLARTGSIDRAERRNRLLDRVTAGWRAAAPAHFVVAAGVTTAAPAIARLLRTVADMERGMVVLPGLDRVMTTGEWEALGPVRPDPETVARPLETHPQYHLKLLLNSMGAARGEVLEW